MTTSVFQNPFRPGAGQRPLYLAGRSKEQDMFSKSLGQNPVMRNVIISGLRGVGKTVLLENLKSIAQTQNWLWTGNDLSETSSLSEERISRRLVTDLSILLGPILVKHSQTLPFGFTQKLAQNKTPISFDDLWKIYTETPGLTEDKLKAVLILIRNLLVHTNVKGIVFAYDEAQNLSDQASDKQYPLSVLLDVFASIQRNHHPVQLLLVLTGLPTLFPKLNEARTYTERMFDVTMLGKLSDAESKLAIEKPIELTNSPLHFRDATVAEIVEMSGGYPYFIQYICKEVFDAWIGRVDEGGAPAVARAEIISKLDQDFFAPRWDRATDRQQEFMRVIAMLNTADTEFTVPEIVSLSKDALTKGFSPSHAVQILKTLVEQGLIYRTKRSKYSFAVPLLADYINRQHIPEIDM
jgi:hypothetical protein